MSTSRTGVFDPIDLKLQPLRITAGWKVVYNNGFYEIDTAPTLVPEEDRWWVFKVDMLQLSHPDRNRLIDLGFSPEGDLINGQYGLEVYEGDFTGRLLHEFRTQIRMEVVTEIERLVKAVTDGIIEGGVSV